MLPALAAIAYSNSKRKSAIFAQPTEKEDYREKEQVEPLPQLQSLELKKRLDRLKYQQLARLVRQTPGFENSPTTEVDIGVAMLAIKELRDPNEVGKVLTQSEQVLEWKESLSSAKYKAKAEDYIESTYQQAVELRETLKQQQLRQQQKTPSLEIE